MNPKNVEQQFNEKLKVLLMDMPFSKRPSGIWYNAAINALPSASPLSMGLTSMEMSVIVIAVRAGLDLSCYNFAVVNNLLEAKSCNDLSFTSIDAYIAFMAEVEELSAEWNKQTAETRENLIKGIVDEQQKMMKESVEGKIRQMPMQPVKE